MSYRNLDLVIVVGITVAVVLAQAVAAPAALRAVLALPLVFYFTGYALVVAALPRGEFGGVERTVLSIGLSIAVAILGGLVLNLLPVGITSGSWLVLLSGVTLSGCIVAARRRMQASSTEVRARLSIRPYQTIMIALALVLVTSAAMIALRPSRATGVDGYTLLWLIPTNGEISSYEFALGVQNMEVVPVDYELRLFAGTERIDTWPAIRLLPGERWEHTVTLIDDLQEVDSVRALLFRNDGLAWPPYRTVEIRR